MFEARVTSLIQKRAEYVHAPALPTNVRLEETENTIIFMTRSKITDVKSFIVGNWEPGMIFGNLLTMMENLSILETKNASIS